nr:ankyrin repeat-containing protein At2g01680-like [Ipomoea batatas]
MLSISESQKKKMLSLLETAAKENNVDILYETIRENPNILKEIEETPFADTPLHVAASHGNTIFAAEMMSLTPYFSRKLNCDGLSPLHLALQNGHLETAREMIGLESGLIRVAGRGKMTAMHFLVSVMGNGENDDVKKKVDLLIDFVWACPEAVSDVTVEGKTPLHIANSVLDKHDIDGNNLMHLAALTHQTEVMRRLKGFVSVTKENKQGLTPADITTERLQGRIKIVNIKQEKQDISNQHRRTFFMSQETLVQRMVRFITCAHRGMSMDKRNMISRHGHLPSRPPTPYWHRRNSRSYNNKNKLTLLVMSGSYITVMRYILEKHKLPYLFSDIIYLMFGVVLLVHINVLAIRVQSRMVNRDQSRKVKIFRDLSRKLYNFNLQIETVLRSPALTTKGEPKCQ